MLVYTTCYSKKSYKLPKTKIRFETQELKMESPDFKGYKCIITSFGGHRVFLVSSELNVDD
jgi:hypothetical protein